MVAPPTMNAARVDGQTRGASLEPLELAAGEFSVGGRSRGFVRSPPLPPAPQGAVGLSSDTEEPAACPDSRLNRRRAS